MVCDAFIKMLISSSNPFFLVEEGDLHLRSTSSSGRLKEAFNDYLKNLKLASSLNTLRIPHRKHIKTETYKNVKVNISNWIVILN